MSMTSDLNQTSLGKKTDYTFKYAPSLLEAIPRSLAREPMGIKEPFAFEGYDIWNSYELSWLNPKGVPQLATLEITVPCTSLCLIESKSLKLYLNSFNNSYFKDKQEVQDCIKTDLETKLQHSISCQLKELSNTPTSFDNSKYSCIDKQDITASCYETNSSLIKISDPEICKQSYYSELLRSRCPVTGQPDWATVYIDTEGPKLCTKGLLQYITSFRNTQEFHETCVEKIFTDLLQEAKMEKLMVYARFTRRGGIDINPLRANFPVEVENERTHRQ